MFVLRAILYWLILLVLFSFVMEESLVWFFFFLFSGSHCRFHFPLSSRVITQSPSPHSLNRLRVLMGKTFSVGRESPGGSRKGALNLVSKRDITAVWVLLFNFKGKSILSTFSVLHLMFYFQLYFPFPYPFSTQGVKNRQPLLLPPPSKPLFFRLHLYFLCFQVLNTFLETITFLRLQK